VYTTVQYVRDGESQSLDPPCVPLAGRVDYVYLADTSRESKEKRRFWGLIRSALLSRKAVVNRRWFVVIIARSAGVVYNFALL
jgi:hypothetical protein